LRVRLPEVGGAILFEPVTTPTERMDKRQVRCRFFVTSKACAKGARCPHWHDRQASSEGVLKPST